VSTRQGGRGLERTVHWQRQQNRSCDELVWSLTTDYRRTYVNWERQLWVHGRTYSHWQRQLRACTNMHSNSTKILPMGTLRSWNLVLVWTTVSLRCPHSGDEELACVCCCSSLQLIALGTLGFLTILVFSRAPYVLIWTLIAIYQGRTEKGWYFGFPMTRQSSQSSA